MFNWEARWPDFAPEEVLSPLGLALYRSSGRLMIQPDALDRFQGFREILGVPMLVNYGPHKLRGYRHQYENDTVAGAAKYSPHVQGLAIDFTPKGMDLEKAFIKAKEWGFPGVGLYRRKNFIHIDVAFRVHGQVIWEVA